MRILTTLITCSFFILSPTLVYGEVKIDGYTYLENQTIHDGIQVKFERTAPSSLLYTVNTVTDGYYSIQLDDGIYKITYSKDGYYEEALTDQLLYSNTTLPNITLIEHKTLINVPVDFNTIQLAIDYAMEGDTVLVSPGTYVENINYNGKNIVVASLTLTTGDTSSYISQTIIDGNQNGHVVEFSSGETSSAVLIGFTVKNGNVFNLGQYPYSMGGGIYCYYSSPTLKNLIVTDNSGVIVGANGGGGGGISLDRSDAVITNVIIKNNVAKSGGGISSNHSNSILTKVTIINNSSERWGGGFYGSNGSATLANVVISENTSQYGGGGVYCSEYDLTLINVTINGNTATDVEGGGIYGGNYSNVQIFNSVMSNNTGTESIYLGSGNILPSYCNFWNNEGGDLNTIIGGFYGVNVTTNANGDSCDAYYNIQKNPLFVDPENGDYHLTEFSPCIDAGDDIGLPYSGLAPDMGTFEFGATVKISDNIAKIPIKFTLLQNHPNPFNPSTAIHYTLPEQSSVNIIIYDILGRKIYQLLSSVQPLGSHLVQWNGTDSRGNMMSAGIYLYQIRAGDFIQTKKMVLMK